MLTILKKILKLQYDKCPSMPRELILFIVGVLVTLCLIFSVLIYRAYTENKRANQLNYGTIAATLAGNLDVYLNDVFMQAEFIGQKIAMHKGNSYMIKNLLKQRFSLDISLDTTLQNKWVQFKWLAYTKQKQLQNSHYPIRKAIDAPWQLHFAFPISHGPNVSDKTIPVSFAVAVENNILGILYADINLESVLAFLVHNLNEQNAAFSVLDGQRQVIAGTIIPKKAEIIFTKPSKNYPYQIALYASDEQLLSRFYNDLIALSIVFIFLAIIFIMMQFSSYKRTISPIIELSDKIKTMLNSDKEVNLTNTSISKEVQFLVCTLKELDHYRLALKQSNKELAVLKDAMEHSMQRFEIAYKTRDKLLSFQNNKTTDEVSVSKIIEESQKVIFPILHSKQIQVSTDIYCNTEKVKTNKLVFVQILIGLIYRAAFFSDQESNIIITAQEINQVDDCSVLQITISDSGIGHEAWRAQRTNEAKLDNLSSHEFMGISYAMPVIKLLAESIDATIKSLDKKIGVTYVLEMLYEKIEITGLDQNVVALHKKK